MLNPVKWHKQGNYEPGRGLLSPTKIQIASIIGKNTILLGKSYVDFELGVSKNDLNLFFVQNDANNNGLAGKMEI